jgi:hypothetical protein
MPGMDRTHGNEGAAMTNRVRTTIVAVLACALLAGCGQDPPESPRAPTPDAKATGIAPVPALSLAAVHSNGAVKCNIETLGGQGFDGALPRIARSGAVPVAGWHAGGGKLLLVIHDEAQSARWSVEVPARTQRPDVSAALGSGAPAATGFAFDLDLANLAPGYYGMYLLDPATGEACAFGRTFALGQR